MDKVTVHIYIEGKVQGVFFRASTKNFVNTLNSVTGRVKNLEDGRVFIEATGIKHEIDKLAEWCYQGSEFAEVNSVEINWQKEIVQYKGFEITYS